jgi:hypothetical protein
VISLEKQTDFACFAAAVLQRRRIPQQSGFFFNGVAAKIVPVFSFRQQRKQINAHTGSDHISRGQWSYL